MPAGGGCSLLNLSWYVAQVSVGLEEFIVDSIEEAIAARNLEELVPCVMQIGSVKPLRGKSPSGFCFKPILPGYIIIQMDLTNEIYNVIKDVEGVFRLFRYAENNLKMESFLKNLDQKLMEIKRDPLKPGDEVVINNGPLKGHKARVQKVWEDRVHIVAECYGREANMDISEFDLEKAS